MPIRTNKVPSMMNRNRPGVIPGKPPKGPAPKIPTKMPNRNGLAGIGRQSKESVWMPLVTFMAKACHYAQDHIDDPDAWSVKKDDREYLLQCVSYQMACFFAQNTVEGCQGVGWDILIDKLIKRPAKTEKQWTTIINRIANDLGGWRK